MLDRTTEYEQIIAYDPTPEEWAVLYYLIKKAEQQSHESKSSIFIGT